MSTGSTVRAGNGRVTSQTLTATVQPRGASSGNGCPHRGATNATRSARSGSASDARGRGARTLTPPGTATSRPVRPKVSRTRPPVIEQPSVAL